MTNLNSGGFTTGIVSRGNRIAILAFEVALQLLTAQTCCSLCLQKMSSFLKQISCVQKGCIGWFPQIWMSFLASLLLIRGRNLTSSLERLSDLEKMCKWHNLDRFFSKLDTDPEIHKQQREVAEITMLELTQLWLSIPLNYIMRCMLWTDLSKMIRGS